MLSDIVRLLPPLTGCAAHGYERYTPTLWLLGMLFGLVVGFNLRYSARVKPWADRLSLQAVELSFDSRLQDLATLFSLGMLAIEFYGLTTGLFTISSWSRSLCIGHPSLYFVGGIATAAVAAPLVDLKGLHPTLKLILAGWVAVGAHIFWWITP